MKKTVIVVDDEVDNVELTVLVLQSAGHTAYGATHGLEGIRLAVDHVADIVVLDFSMPGMGGEEVGRSLRANPLTCNVKILMCSGTAEPIVRVAFAAYDAFLIKPLNGLDLIQAIARL